MAYRYSRVIEKYIQDDMLPIEYHFVLASGEDMIVEEWEYRYFELNWLYRWKVAPSSVERLTKMLWRFCLLVLLFGGIWILTRFL